MGQGIDSKAWDMLCRQVNNIEAIVDTMNTRGLENATTQGQIKERVINITEKVEHLSGDMAEVKAMAHAPGCAFLKLVETSLTNALDEAKRVEAADVKSLQASIGRGSRAKGMSKKTLGGIIAVASAAIAGIVELIRQWGPKAPGP